MFRHLPKSVWFSYGVSDSFPKITSSQCKHLINNTKQICPLYLPQENDLSITADKKPKLRWGVKKRLENNPVRTHFTELKEQLNRKYTRRPTR